jgi:hypothetical protein
MTLRAITVRQPWASAIAIGGKSPENRGRNTGLRGEIAIHAGLTLDYAGADDPQVIRVLGPNPLADVVTGAIVAVAELVDCHDAEQPLLAGATCCWPWGQRFHNDGVAFHLVLADIRALAVPVPCRGALPIGWQVPGDVEAQVREQLAGVRS